MQKTTKKVKICKRHRVGITVFCALIFLILTICVLSMQRIAAILLYIPVLAIMLPIVLYFWTWQIHFEEHGIVKSVFFRKSKTYPFIMLREVVKCYYGSKQDFTIRMFFVDGKIFQLRMDDKNSTQAVKELLKHCSIKNR